MLDCARLQEIAMPPEPPPNHEATIHCQIPEAACNPRAQLLFFAWGFCRWMGLRKRTCSCLCRSNAAARLFCQSPALQARCCGFLHHFVSRWGCFMLGVPLYSFACPARTENGDVNGVLALKLPDQRARCQALLHSKHRYAAQKRSGDTLALNPGRCP